MTRPTRRRPPAWPGLAALAPALLTTLAGCAAAPAPHLYSEPPVAAGPEVAWSPPAALPPVTPPPSSARTTLPQELLAPGAALTLADLVDLALRNSPDTAATWARARAAAADMASQRGDYYPQLDGTLSASRTQGTFANGRISYFQQSYQPGIELSWLLFDFGGRSPTGSSRWPGSPTRPAACRSTTTA